nr:MAG TPA: hypothetical protein [Caudoviricetes sp.]
MKRTKKEMILQAWESFEIKEEAEKVYGRPVPLNKQAAVSIWEVIRKNSKVAYTRKISNYGYELLSLFGRQLIYLIRVDSLCGGGQSEIGESIFGNSFSKNGKKRKKVKAVRTGRKNKLAHKPSVQNFLNGNFVVPDNGFITSGHKSLRKLLRKSGCVRKF